MNTNLHISAVESIFKRSVLRTASLALVESLERRSLFAVSVPGSETLATLAPAATTEALATAVSGINFSQSRGFYTSAFNLTLSTDADASIRYTTDGSAPTTTTGTLYTGPIAISKTTVVRAIAYQTGLDPTAVMTHSYFFLADVIRQPKTITGYPTPQLPTSKTTTTQLDYAMDPTIVDATAYKDKIIPALKSIPTLSIAVPKDRIFGSNGFYEVKDIEVPISFEFIDPNHPEDTTQINAGIEAHAEGSQKRSLRVSFKGEYAGNLKENIFAHAPVGSSSAANEVDQLVLRAGNNRSWTVVNQNKETTFTEDEFVRETQIALSGEGVHGTYAHLYINGIYFGMYNMVERPNDGFGEIYYGGEKDDWFSTNHDMDVKSGDPTRWNYMLDTLRLKDMSNPTNYAEMKQYLDVSNFADYLISHFYAGVTDWPFNNWWAGGDTVKQMPFKFYTWDAEFQFNTVNVYSTPPYGAWVHPQFRKGATDGTSPILKLWRSVIKSPEFKIMFADRAFKAVNGALTDSEALKRLDALNSFINDAVIGESARWGDSLASRGQPRRTRDGDWIPATQAIRSLIPGNANKLLSALRTEGYYPSINGPSLSSKGGQIDPGFVLSVTNPNSVGTIYYTLDGSDPRLVGGGLNPVAKVYSSTTKIPLNATTTVRVRIRNSTEWSAINEATFAVKTANSLRFSEMMYHPVAPAGSLIDKDEFEFVEFKNTSNASINLNGIVVGSGIDFTFGDINLPAGAYILIVKNQAAFESLYGTGFNIAGQYSGKLDNGGERLTLTGPGNVPLADFTYDDAWYPETDGVGLTMVVRNPAADPATLNDPAAWGPSSVAGGTPDAADTNLNGAPVVNAGADKSVQIANGASLSGTVNDDGKPAGGTLTSAWTKVSGPGDVTFGDAAALATTASFSAVGTYVLRLTGNDGQLTTFDDVTINVVDANAAGALRGYAFNDTDADGVLDSSEAKTGGKTVFLDTDNDGVLDAGERSMVTNSVGEYAFTDLAPGLYHVRRVFPSGYTYSTAPIDIQLQAGDDIGNLAIGSRYVTAPPPPSTTRGSIAGTLFWDSDKDGVFDSNESGQSGKTVFIDLDGDGALDTNETRLVTDSQGAFKFGNLFAGTYRITRVVPSGYRLTTISLPIVLAAGQNVTGIKIGTAAI